MVRKGLCGHGRVTVHLTPWGGGGHRALPWEQTAAVGGLAAPAEAPGTQVWGHSAPEVEQRPRFSVQGRGDPPQWEPTGCGQGWAPARMSPGAGLVLFSTRCASCLPQRLATRRGSAVALRQLCAVPAPWHGAGAAGSVVGQVGWPAWSAGPGMRQNHHKQANPSR